MALRYTDNPIAARYTQGTSSHVGSSRQGRRLIQLIQCVLNLFGTHKPHLSRKAKIQSVIMPIQPNPTSAGGTRTITHDHGPGLELGIAAKAEDNPDRNRHREQDRYSGSDQSITNRHATDD